MELTDKEKAAPWERMQEINRKSFQRRQTWIKLMLAKAEKAGIKVSDEEVARAMKG